MATWCTIAREKSRAEQNRRNQIADLCNGQKRLEAENARLEREIKRLKKEKEARDA